MAAFMLMPVNICLVTDVGLRGICKYSHRSNDIRPFQIVPNLCLQEDPHPLLDINHQL